MDGKANIGIVKPNSTGRKANTGIVKPNSTLRKPNTRVVKPNANGRKAHATDEKANTGVVKPNAKGRKANATPKKANTKQESARNEWESAHRSSETERNPNPKQTKVFQITIIHNKSQKTIQKK